CPLDGHTITDCGVVAIAAEGFDISNGLDLNTEGAYRKHYTPDNPINPAFYTWIKTNVEAGDVWYIRPFLETDGEIVYGELVTITAGTPYSAGIVE
ncbi:MAG: hypothetical protein IJM85_07590, partial [Clostridia bacterium]|nr:hypothetical protein [Clostridia bacterium]